MLKRYIFLFFMTLIVVSCAAPQEIAIVPPRSSPSPTSATGILTAVPLTSTPDKTFVPKQNDWIFIEFFAGT